MWRSSNFDTLRMLKRFFFSGGQESRAEVGAVLAEPVIGSGSMVNTEIGVIDSRTEDM